ncbi:Membrane proteins related to metalloendopeptidases [hydrothermal vent metagenome]|uniref:Membrane proteins related to metalloendopeptidases n=1 Tax=hydrothermal vent metagenome TaxID=652676 RepID=A0A1W1BW40_9ZZZZ
MKKILYSFILLAMLSTLLSAKTYHWKKGTTFLSFLRNNGIPQKLYYNLDSDDKELIAEIRSGQKYSIKKNRILIPITDELQIQIIGKKKLSLEPIPFETLKGSIHLTVKKSFEKELYAKTHSKGLLKSLKSAYTSLNLKKIKKGDKISIFYEQKRRDGKAIDNPKILASHITINKKSYYNYLAKDGKHYDSLGEEYKKIKKSYTPYIRPIQNTRVSSGFTHRRFHPILHRYKAHLGIDYANCTGTPIKSTAKGKIIYRGWKGGYGRCIKIQHANGLVSLYAHMSRYRKGLKVGSWVPQGKIIGYVGSSGRSTGAHLHFGMYKNGKAINPARYVRVTKHKTLVHKLKGKDYIALRKKVVHYRNKFKKLRKNGGKPLYIKKNNYLVMRDNRAKKVNL